MSDFNQVAPKLYQGGRVNRFWPGRSFDVVVLCAEEHQPELVRFAGMTLRCPIDDAAPTPRERKMAYSTAQAVADALRSGRRVLVTCAAGLNRSGLVTAMALQLSTRVPLESIIKLVRSARGASALNNPHFVALLEEFEVKRQGVLVGGRAAA